MNISEKLEIIAENQQKVYDAGVEAGKQEMYDEIVSPNIIPATATGVEYMHLNDISEISHNISIQLSSDTITDFSNVTVTTIGKNLVDWGTVEVKQYKILFEDTENPLPVQQYTFSAIVTSTDTDDNKCCFLYWYADKTYNTIQLYRDTKNSATFIPQKPIVKIQVYASSDNGQAVGDTAFFQDCQLEVGPGPTPYEPCIKETYMTNIDGSVDNIASKGHNMTIYTDNPNITLTVEYNKSPGIQAAYDRFWDSFQQNGNRNQYFYAFAGTSWNDTTFNPKYDITCNYAERLFTYSQITNLKAILERNGVVLDLRTAIQRRTATQLFMSSEITHLPTIDCSTAAQGTGGVGYLFYRADKLVSIEKWILPTAACTFGENDTFNGCTSLVDIVIEGMLWCSLSMKDCPLSRASIENVISVLADAATGKTLTLKQAAVNAAFTTDEWNTLVSTKPNWTIALA